MRLTAAAASALMLAMIGVGASHAACPLPSEAGALLSAGPVQLAWRAEPAVLVVGQPFSLFVSLCPADVRLTRVDATMPEHRNGMNYRPTIQPLAPGRWRAEGLLWHMSGRWQLRLDVAAADGSTITARHVVTLP